MSFNLLASSAIGLFIAMLVIMIVVVLLFGFLLFMIFRQRYKPNENANVYNVKRMLARRETQITIEIMNNKEDEAKKAELVNKLRRVKSAILLVDELLEEEKAISGITEPESGKGKPKRLNPQGKNGHRPTPKPTGEQSADNADGQAERKVAPSEQPVVKANVKKKKPEKKKKDKLEFKPSED